MTALAAATGSGCGHAWSWEIRSVNGKARDLRLRLPETLAALEAPVRKALGEAVVRGSVTCGLRLSRDGAEGAALDPARIDDLLQAVAALEAAAAARGLVLAPTSAAELLALPRQTRDSGPPDAEAASALNAAVMESFPAVLEAFEGMRIGEGAALARVLHGQLDTIAGLVDAAAAGAETRATAQRAGLEAALARLRDAAPDIEPDRIAQELALLAVKSDVTEEIDRLRAHVEAARALLDAPGAVGRKLDFLCQEFNREANTLCSKAQSSDLTAIGLDLKHVIDQFREQVQNLE